MELRLAAVSTESDAMRADSAVDWSTPRHVVAVFDYTGGDHTHNDMKLYIDGSPVAMTAQAITLTTQDTTTAYPLTMAARYLAASEGYMGGYLQYVAMFDTALSASDAAALYAAFTTYLGEVSDGVSLSETIPPLEVGSVVTEGEDIGEVVDPLAVSILRDLVRLTESQSLYFTRAALVQDAARLADAVIRGAWESLSSALSLSDAAALGIGTRIRESTVLLDTPYAHLVARVADVVDLTERLVLGTRELVAEAVRLGDASGLGQGLVLFDLVSLSETFGDGVAKDVALLLQDAATLGDATNPLAAYQAAVFDGLLGGGALVLDGVTYEAWVLNTRNLAPSRYEGFNFNSVAGGYGARSDGIYRLEGADDAGTAIAAHVETGLMTHKTQHLKRVPEAYLVMAGGDTLYLKFATSANGRDLDAWYQATPVHYGPGAIQYSMAKGLKARYWKYRLEAVDVDFELDGMEVRALVLQRRV